MNRIIPMMLVFVMSAVAHNSYTGGYSGAPGRSTCASSCHGGTGGTLQVIGFPISYIPGQTYPITITHNGGNKFVNVNATTRLGTTAAVAGSFVAGSGSALYTGADGGVYVPTHLIDTIVFQWKAPGAGSGPVTLYAAGFQNSSTTSSAGQSSEISLSATEGITGVVQMQPQPWEFALLQNYPNPFNPTTTISYQLQANSHVTLKVYDVLGREIAILVNGRMPAGRHAVSWDGSRSPSGLYFCRISTDNFTQTRKMLLTK